MSDVSDVFFQHFKALAVTVKYLMPWQHFQICSHSPGHLMLKIDLTGQWPYPIAGEESMSRNSLNSGRIKIVKSHF